MMSESRSCPKSSLSTSQSRTIPLMRFSEMKAGRRREVRSEATDCTTLRSTTPRLRSQRKKERSDEISRFIDAAPIRSFSVRWRIHSRISSVATRRSPSGESSTLSHARNCATS